MFSDFSSIYLWFLRYVMVVITRALTSRLCAWHEINHSFCMLLSQLVRKCGSVFIKYVYMYIYGLLFSHLKLERAIKSSINLVWIRVAYTGESGVKIDHITACFGLHKMPGFDIKTAHGLCCEVSRCMYGIFIIIQRQQLKIRCPICAFSNISRVIFSVNWPGAGRVENMTQHSSLAPLLKNWLSCCSVASVLWRKEKKDGTWWSWQ